ncbi:MAG: hypothetical protein WC831_03265 [Parcubacteria group bacterium]|jgi:hypothetical protein
MRNGSGNKRQYDALRTIILVIGALALFFTIGFLYGERETLRSVKLANEARRHSTFAVVTWQKTAVDSRVEECERMIEDLLFEEEIITAGLQDLFRNFNYQPNLKIWWNRKRVRPGTAVLIYNEADLPSDFTEKGKPEFILPHNAKKGDVVMLLGEKDGVVRVYFPTGDFAGKIGTFEPSRRFDRQGALVYREIGFTA